MTSDEIQEVELPALEHLQCLGWSYISGARFSPKESDERNSIKDVVLINRLIASIKRINPWISKDNLHWVVQNLTKVRHTSLIEVNQKIWTQINQCVSVKQDVGHGDKGQTVHIFDFDNPENNEFLCTNQFKVSGTKQIIIPDIVLFINGLPLAVIECKSPYSTNPIEAGIEQLRRYANIREPSTREGAERLFHYNLMMVSTCRNKARVGTITSRMEHFLEWKDPYPLTVDQVGGEESSQDVLIAGLFSKANFLDILQNFTIFETVDGYLVKKMARYQQFRAVHKTIKRIKFGGDTRKEKSGVIWHTQGSGKSLTMVFLSIKMRRDPVLQGYKMVFLTDRTQLDNQLTDTFQNTQGETVFHAGSAKELKGLLAKDSSDIVTAMTQKFHENAVQFEFPVLNESEKIIVLTDEAHRTQYGTLGAAISKALPNAPRIAFTGTPLIKSQKTVNTFGSYIDIYTIDQAVKDEATVQILYEGREPDVSVTGEGLDSMFNENFKNYHDDEKAEIKRKHGTRQAILEAPRRIRQICVDILEHYRKQIEPNGFKGMIVTSSRRAAITYKEQLDDLKSPQSAVIISGNQNDKEYFLQYTDRTKQKQQIDDFKRPFGTAEDQSNLCFLIVKDMLLTGFDAPIAQVMYLDQKLTNHSLLQAIARVNRINKNKFRGYIVDYYGLSDYLTEALEMFSAKDIQGALIEYKEEIPRLKNAHTRVLKHFEGMNLEDIESCILSLGDETKRQNFQMDFRLFSKQMDIVLPDSAASSFIRDIKRLGKIAIGARNLYRDDQLNIVGAGEKVRELIEEYVHSMGIDPKIPPVDLLAVDFKEKLDQHKSDRARASEIENAIRHHIRINIDNDPEYYKNLSERLEDIIRKHEEKWDELVQILFDLRIDIEKYDYRHTQSSIIGLSKDELSFYNSLVAELGEKESINETTKKKVTVVVQKLFQILHEETAIVDFFKKENEQKKIRRDIKRLLIENFDSSLAKSLTDRLMELARRKFDR